ncbi:hypothetical protein HH213_20525 [Duganella dendranthematis]|uniref:Two component regulator propeller domain-containing protein n=1 Tax=Duganella dendranthematis TaxID=2728021 RepID=A0ABX6MDU3_9BURK|nr:hypothetical protein [Duganella dendranthematis]QJD92268.1 hypothetical protein HH213_20525 [Duganella dendranthematis]
MQTLLRSALLCLILAVCTCRAAAAPDEAAADSKTELSQPVIDLLHTSWTAQEGAPAGISGIAQTPDGWIWIGSNSGLYKFDGVRFLRITGRQGPMASHISNIGVLKDGRLWVGYVYGGVSIQDGDGMRHFPTGPGGLPTTLVYDAALDASGRLWLATAAGSFYFDSRWHPARLSSDMPDGRCTPSCSTGKVRSGCDRKRECSHCLRGPISSSASCASLSAACWRNTRTAAYGRTARATPTFNW